MFLFHPKNQNTENYPLFWWTLIGGLHQCPELIQWQTTSRSKERSAGSSTGMLEATINNHDQLRKESNTPSESNGLLINMTVIYCDHHKNDCFILPLQWNQKHHTFNSMDQLLTPQIYLSFFLYTEIYQPFLGGIWWN